MITPRLVSLTIQRPPLPAGWFDASRTGGRRARVLSRAVLDWRTSVADQVRSRSTPTMIGNVDLAIFASRRPDGLLLDPHGIDAIVDVLRCCRVIGSQDQIVSRAVREHGLPLGERLLVLATEQTNTISLPKSWEPPLPETHPHDLANSVLLSRITSGGVR